MEQTNYIVGKDVEYAIKNTVEIGFVVDKISMINASDNKNLQPIQITGYLIRSDSDGKIYDIPYWRIKKIFNLA